MSKITTTLERKQNRINDSYVYNLTIENGKLHVVFKYPSDDSEDTTDLTIPSASGGNCSKD